jgi:5-methylcytosine-specific restriction endonuclease McrA
MKEKITHFQRYAVYTVHSEKCYLCKTPISLADTEIDHVIPESLQGDPVALNKVLAEFGLPSSFAIHSFENWLPACRPCNGLKSNTVPTLAPIIYYELKKARDKAPEAQRILERLKSQNTRGKLITVIMGHLEAGTLKKTDLDSVAKEFAALHNDIREAESMGAPISVSASLSVLPGGRVLEKKIGAFGVGFGPSSSVVQNSARCGSCGGHHWNGPRCVTCGAMDDGD